MAVQSAEAVDVAKSALVKSVKPATDAASISNGLLAGTLGFDTIKLGQSASNTRAAQIQALESQVHCLRAFRRSILTVIYPAAASHTFKGTWSVP